MSSSMNEVITTRSGARPAEEQFQALFEAAARVVRYHADRASSVADDLIPLPPVRQSPSQQPMTH